MRLCAKDVPYVVGAAPAGSPRPVRPRAGGITYALTAHEAIQLATKLADIVGELNTLERKHQHV